MLIAGALAMFEYSNPPQPASESLRLSSSSLLSSPAPTLLLPNFSVAGSFLALLLQANIRMLSFLNPFPA